MGDRVWALIKIGGHLETVGDVEALVTAIVNEGVVDDAEDAKTALRHSVESGIPFEHEGDQVNYGTFGILESAIEANPKLSSITCFGRGGDFDSGSKTVHEGKSTTFYGDDRAIPRREARTILHEQGVEALLKRIDELDFLEDGCVTKLTASPAVAAWLKIFGEKAA